MFYVLLFGRGRGPRPNRKKNMPPPKQQKNKHAPAPSKRFFAVWVGGRVYFFAVWAEVVFFFAAVWVGVHFFLLFGRGTGVHSLTGLPGCLARH